MAFLAVQLSTCFGAAGDLDMSFGGTGKVKLGMGGGFAQGFAAAVQSDGKLIIAGLSNPKQSPLFGSQHGGDFLLARFDTNNVLDPSFGEGGVVVTQVSTNYPDFQSSQINALLIQSDGKIVAGGYSYQKTNYSTFTLLRYNTNGTVDTSFGISGTGIVTTDIGHESQIKGLALQFGTNIVAAGFGSDNNAVPDSIMVTVYNNSGALEGLDLQGGGGSRGGCHCDGRRWFDSPRRSWARYRQYARLYIGPLFNQRVT